MKVILMASIVMVCFASQVLAQGTKKVEEPEFIGVFFGLGEGGTLRQLERQTPEQKIKVKALGFGGGEGFLQIKGEQSSIRYRANEKIAFVVRVASQQTDPVSIIQFFRFEPFKGVRRLMLAKVGSIGISSKTTAGQSAISFDAAKYGESSFKVVPAYLLTPGEYCLSGPGTADGFCFGIDAATIQ